MKSAIAAGLMYTGTICMLFASAPSAAAGADKAIALDRFAWLAGAWVLDDGKQHVEEFWSTPAPDMMIGMSRTLRDGKTSAFEFLRIVSHDDAVFYVAQPRGKPPVEFRLASFDGAQAVFVNAGTSDHLQRIVYRHNADDSLAARIEGTDAGKSFAEDYVYRRTPSHKQQ